MAEEQQNNGLQFEDIVPYVNDSGDTGLTSRLKLKRNFDKIKLWAQQVAASVGNLTTTIGNLATSIENALSGLDDKYLSKTDDDTAAGTITFADGITFGDGNTGIDENGDAELRDATMRDVTGRDAEFENLRVTKEAHFFKLVVDELLSNKGAIIISSANCVAEIVVADPDHETPYYYDVYFPTTDRDGNSVSNPWVAGDQAVCLTFKGEGSGTFNNVKNRYYWRLVNLASSNVTYDGGTYHLVRLSNASGDFDGSTVPAAGDNIVQLGYQDNDNDARQTAIILSSYPTMDTGVTPPSLAFYKGINDFALSSHRYTYMDGVANEFFGDFKVLVNNSYTSMTTLLATTNRLIAEIRNDLGTVGVDINSDDMAINLKAGKVNFLMPDGSTNAKISIDPITGTLKAVDGQFDGTVKANNLYHGVCFLSAVGGFLNHRWYCKPQDAYGNDSWPYIKESLEYTFDFNVREYYTTEEILQISDNIIQSPAESGFERCSGYSDIVYVLPAVNNTYPEVWLPHPADVEGKVVDVYGFYYGTQSTIPSFDVRCVFKNSQQEARMALLLEYNTEASPKLIVSSPSPYLPVTAGQLTRFVSVRAVVNNVEGCYWLKINLSEGSGGSGVTETRVIELIQSNAATRQWVNDQHFLTSFTETDPTVPSWAKQSSKPSYQFSEIGGSVAASQLPTLYWANVAISNQSNNNTSPQFGELRLQSGSSYYGSHLYFGDESHCYLYENSDDHLKIHADKGIELSVDSNYSVTYGGYEIATQSWVSNQGFLISSAISDMATQTWVQNTAKAHEAVSADSATYASRLQGSNSGTTDNTPSAYSLTGTYARVYSETVNGTNTAIGTSGSYEQRITFAMVEGAGNSANRPVQLSLCKDGIFFRTSSTSSAWNSWNKIWHSGNDGSGSGLDADTVDGIEGSALLQKSAITIVQTISNGDSSITLGDISAIKMPFTISEGVELNPAYLPLSGGTINGSLGVNGSSEFGGQIVVKTYGDAKLVLNDMPNGNTEPEGYTYIEFRETNTLNETSVDGKLGLFGDGVLKWMESNNTLHTIATQDWVNSQGHVASAGALKYGGNTKAEAGLNGVTVTGQLVTTNSVVAQGGIVAGHVDIDDDLNFVRIRSIYSSQTQERYVEFVGYGENDGTEAPTAYKFDSEVRATAFKKTGSSNDYVLLGGGGTKAVIDFATWMDRPVTARGLNVAGDSTMAAPHVRMTYDYVSAGRYSMNFKGYAGDDMVAPISYIFDAPVTQSSDIRMKNVTESLEPSVYDMASAPLVRFRWKNDAAGAEHVGTVAQFWQQVVPEAVVETADGMLAMDYGVAGVVAGVTAARKAVELERRLEEQERRIAELEAIINQLKK